MTPHEVRERVYDLCADIEFEDPEENALFLHARDDTLFETMCERGERVKITDARSLEDLLGTLKEHVENDATGWHLADIIDAIAEEVGGVWRVE